LTKYDRSTIPARQDDTTIPLYIGMSLFHILDTVITAQSLFRFTAQAPSVFALSRSRLHLEKQAARKNTASCSAERSRRASIEKCRFVRSYVRRASIYPFSHTFTGRLLSLRLFGIHFMRHGIPVLCYLLQL